MIAKTRLVPYFLTTLAAAWIAWPAAAAVFMVPDGDVGALIEAINTSNFNGEDDTIELAPNAHYVLPSPVDTCYNTGLPAIRPDGGRATLTIRGNGARVSRDSQNPQKFRIMAGGLGSAFHLIDLTISGGSSSSGQPCGSSLADGGALYMYHAAVTVERCVFENNAAEGRLGGAIYNLSGLLIVHDSVFSGNVSTLGGAIASGGDGETTVHGCRFSHNAAGLGGAISSYGNYRAVPITTTVSDSTFVGNSASEFGGAIDNAGHTSFAIRHSTFSGNTASSGGAIANHDGFNLAALIVDSCTMFGNTAANGSGGGIYNFGDNDGTTGLTAFVTVANSTFSNNSASTYGGAIYNDRTTIGSNDASTTVGNSILKSGTAGENIHNAAGTISSQGYNLSDDGGGGLLSATGDQINVEPGLDPSGLQNNGGPTQTIALLPGSPAINAGDPQAPARDQRYYLRSGQPDIGAFEHDGVLAPLAVVSRKIHGAAGAFDIDLPLAGSPGVESRRGGAQGDHQIVLTFATPVTVGNVSVIRGSGSCSQQSTSGFELALDLTGVANAQQILLNVSGVSDGVNTGAANVPLSILLGDTDGNQAVNASDVAQTKGQAGQPLTSANFRSDGNASGTINASDVALVKTQTGTSIPPDREPTKGMR